MLCYYFSLEALLQCITKNNPTEKQIDGEIDDIEACVSVKTHKRENVLCIVTNRKDTVDLNYKL